MATQLHWEYQNSASIPEYRAEYKGLVIRAINDQHPSNPFEDQDGHFPMSVWVSGDLTDYDKADGGHARNPLHRFTDEALVHNQIHIALTLKSTVPDLIECYGTEEPVKYSRDPGLLRDVFTQAFEDNQGFMATLDLCVPFYEMLGIPCLRHSSRGYSQSDWAEVLIVATPEACKEFGVEPNVEMLKEQAKLYDAWAWGDVYGYQIARPVLDEDGEDTGEVEDVDDVEGSCWGFYGSDFDWSGLEEQAISSADYFVRSPDTIEEADHAQV